MRLIKSCAKLSNKQNCWSTSFFLAVATSSILHWNSIHQLLAGRAPSGWQCNAFAREGRGRGRLRRVSRTGTMITHPCCTPATGMHRNHCSCSAYPPKSPLPRPSATKVLHCHPIGDPADVSVVLHCANRAVLCHQLLPGCLLQVRLFLLRRRSEREGKRSRERSKR